MSFKTRYLLGVAALTCALTFLAASHGWRAKMAKSREQAQPTYSFQLQDTTGKTVSLEDFRHEQATVLVFIGTECPLVNLYILRLAELQRDFAPRGVQILAINSNPQDTPEDIARHAQDRKLPFPVLIDPGQKVADLFGAKRTPEVVVLDGAGAVRYRGRIDDRYRVGGDRGTPTRHDLVEALEEILANRPVRVRSTPVTGCLIPRREPARPVEQATYARDIAPLLQKHCQDCHRPGQVAPFSLLNYEQARDWSATIGEVVRAGRMPPWHADPRHGKFANDRSLPEAERSLLLTWIEQGCPKGDDRDLPAPRIFPEGWGIGTPDRVLSMKTAFTVPAQAPKGGIPYQRFVLAESFDRDVWVRAVEARPGNRAVVHHMLLFIGNPPSRTRPIETGDRDILVGFVPGARPAIFPPGLGKRIPRGARLVLEMHYTANGTEQTHLSSVGLVFATEPPRHEARTRVVANSTFAIPRRAADHEVAAATTFEKDAVLLRLAPHMHLRGKSFLFRAVYPDNRSEILLSVPRYDFNWQQAYVLKKPLHMPAGTRIECVARFDNSADNPNNPDPDKEVRFGDQSWEEMMIGWVTYYYKEEAPVRDNR